MLSSHPRFPGHAALSSLHFDLLGENGESFGRALLGECRPTCLSDPHSWTFTKPNELFQSFSFSSLL